MKSYPGAAHSNYPVILCILSKNEPGLEALFVRKVYRFSSSSLLSVSRIKLVLLIALIRDGKVPADF